jgi:hypothetical protein
MSLIIAIKIGIHLSNGRSGELTVKFSDFFDFGGYIFGNQVI